MNMSMVTFLLNIILFSAVVYVHLIICRQSSTKELKIKSFMVLGLMGLLLFWGIALCAQLPMLVTNTVIFVLMMPVYFTFYVSTELMSPSKKIMQVLNAKPGALYEDIFQALERENFLMTRLIELKQCGFIVEEGGRYRLSPTGASFARTYTCYQKLLGREIGG